MFVQSLYAYTKRRNRDLPTGFEGVYDLYFPSNVSIYTVRLSKAMT